jgi:thiamine-phosphate pyrophosphorylase
MNAHFAPAKFQHHLRPTTLIDMLRCAITDRTLFSGDESQRQTALFRQAALWAHRGFDLIQLREKDLNTAELAQLASHILAIIAAASSPSRLLLNASSQAIARLAVELRAPGVHLPSNATLTPGQVRQLYAEAQLPSPVITIACHSLAEVERARDQAVDAILFAPVFGKFVAGELVAPGTGLWMLREACSSAAPTPVYALGGVTHENADLCMKAGAAGVAGIRLFVSV